MERLNVDDTSYSAISESITSDPVQFVRAVEELPIGVIAYQGPEHVVLGANRAARAFFGHRRNLVGHPIREVFPEVEGQHIFEFQHRVYLTGEPFTASEWRVVVADGAAGQERVVNFELVPLRGADGAVTGVACHFVDVTDAVLRRRSLEADTVMLRQRYQAAQDVVLTLQRSLLPTGLPVLPGIRVAAHYLVASAEQAAGGDWFDAIPLAGRMVAVVGDVVGHGAAASAVMGQLRAVVEEFLLDGDDLALVLARLDRFASRVPGARGATVCLAAIDPEDGAVSYACAGHPPPLVVSGNGTTRFLPAPGGGPLGVAGPAAVVGRTELASGDVLLCFSDGLVERRGQDQSVALTELAHVASAAMRVGAPSLMSADAVERVAELTMERMTRDGYQDDVTLLAVRLTGQRPDEFTADLPAQAGQLGVLQERLEAWLTALGAAGNDLTSVEVAVLEAVSNAVEHAYDGPGGRVRVDGLLDQTGRVCMTVSDQGIWRAADGEQDSGGPGLLMMRAAMDTVEIEHSSEGTTLLLDLQLRRPPVLTSAPTAPAGSDQEPTASLDTTVSRSARPRVTLTGPIDISTVPGLRRRLWSASRGGSLPLTVDLGRVTHLSSAGVQLLFDLAEEMTADGVTLQLAVPAGSPARYVTSLTGLDEVVTVIEG